MVETVLVSIHGMQNKKGNQKKGMKTVGDVAFGRFPSKDSYAFQQKVSNVVIIANWPIYTQI